MKNSVPRRAGVGLKKGRAAAPNPQLKKGEEVQLCFCFGGVKYLCHLHAVNRILAPYSGLRTVAII